MSTSFPYKRVVVTGGSGFLGRYVVHRLRQFPALEVIVPSHQEYNLVEHSAAQRLLSLTRPDLVIHLAAIVGGIGANQKSPGKFFYDNLMMGVQLIEQARLHEVQKFVAVGTVCAYPKFAPTPFHEVDLWNGYPDETNAPYGLAKKMMLVQAQAYRAEYGFNAIYLLPVNLYGPGDNFDLESSHVIPALIRKCVEAKESGTDHVVLWGDGSPTREFLFVEDAAEGLVLAVEHYDGADPVNLGSGKEISIRDLATTIAEQVGYRGNFVWDKTKPNGQPRRCLDVTRAKERFGFQAACNLREGLAKTIDWFLANRHSLHASAL